MSTQLSAIAVGRLQRLAFRDKIIAELNSSKVSQARRIMHLDSQVTRLDRRGQERWCYRQGNETPMTSSRLAYLSCWQYT